MNTDLRKFRGNSQISHFLEEENPGEFTDLDWSRMYRWHLGTHTHIQRYFPGGEKSLEMGKGFRPRAAHPVENSSTPRPVHGNIFIYLSDLGVFTSLSESFTLACLVCSLCITI